MSSTVALAPISSQTLGRVNWSMTVASQKAAKAQERAEKAVEAANAARKRAYDEMMCAGTTKHVTASARTSTKSFAAKDPAHALAALAYVDLGGDVSKHDFSEVGVVAYKYSVRTASERMTQPVADSGLALYPSTRASAMMAAKTVRYLYKLALEIAMTHPEQHAEARRVIEWHSPQSILKGRDTRGAGIAAQAL